MMSNSNFINGQEIDNCLNNEILNSMKEQFEALNNRKSTMEENQSKRYGWSYQCDKCDFTAVKVEELKSHVEAVYRHGVQHLLYFHY